MGPLIRYIFLNYTDLSLTLEEQQKSTTTEGNHWLPVFLPPFFGSTQKLLEHIVIHMVWVFPSGNKLIVVF